jgi:hypothetical protein
MTWSDFKEKFRKRDVPTGLINMMCDKFYNLKQGSMTIVEYMERFTDIGMYAPDEVDRGPRRRSSF